MLRRVSCVLCESLGDKIPDKGSDKGVTQVMHHTVEDTETFSLSEVQIVNSTCCSLCYRVILRGLGWGARS